MKATMRRFVQKIAENIDPDVTIGRIVLDKDSPPKCPKCNNMMFSVCSEETEETFWVCSRCDYNTAYGE